MKHPPAAFHHVCSDQRNGDRRLSINRLESGISNVRRERQPGINARPPTESHSQGDGCTVACSGCASRIAKVAQAVAEVEMN